MWPFASSRPPASPQKGLMTMAETLSGTYGPHRIEVELHLVTEPDRPGLEVTLFVDGQIADQVRRGLRGLHDAISLTGVLPGQAGKLVEASTQLRQLSFNRYEVRADGQPVPMAIRRGRRHEAPS